MSYFVVFLILIGLIVPAFAQGQPCMDSAFPDTGKQVNLDHDITGGKIIEICQSAVDNSVIVKIDADTDGVLSIEIPAFMVYSLVGTNCEQDPSQIFVIMDQEEIPLLDLKSTESTNIFTVGFDRGTHIIEFIGSFVIPSPSPAQYCGIVKGYDKTYLPPKIQVELGVESKFIRCNESLMLVFKSDGTPACVKPETKGKLMDRGWAIDPIFYGLTKSQITDIQLAKMGCKKLGNQTYCDEMIREKTEFYLQQNNLNTKSIPEMISEPEPESNLQINVVNPVTTPQKIIVAVGNNMPHSKILPVSTTEITKIIPAQDELTAWAFQPLKDTKGKDWDFAEHTFEVLDQSGNDAIDRNRLPEHYVWDDVGREYPLVCDYIGKVTAKSRVPLPVPIKDSITEAHATYSNIGLLPDKSGTYTLEFASLHEQKIVLPENANILSSSHNVCHLESDSSTTGYYDKIVFKVVE